MAASRLTSLVPPVLPSVVAIWVSLKLYWSTVCVGWNADAVDRAFVVPIVASAFESVVDAVTTWSWETVTPLLANVV
jgi:uncharacterized protein YqgC (DUF456 family)